MMANHLFDDRELMAREPDLERLRQAHGFLSTNVARALADLETLAREGSVLSMLYLAQTYQLGPKPDPVKAERWYRSAYEKGSSTALFSLGTTYYRQGDYATAEKFFSEGVSKNDIPSMYWLATIYLVGPARPGHAEQARVLLEKAIQGGHVHAKHGLGLLYLKRRFGTRNMVRGLWLFLTGMIDAFRVTYRDPSSRRLW